MLEINGTLIVLVLSFLLFMWALNLVFVKPVAATLAARASKIDDDIETSRKLAREAQEILDEYQKNLVEIRTNAQNVIQDSLMQAQKTRSAQLAKVMEEGRQKVEAARASLAFEKKQLLDDLVAEEIKIVDTILTKLVGPGLTGNLSGNQALVKKALEEAL